MNAPRIDRPAIPAEYGITKATEFVEWSHVEERLAADRVYWVVTVGRNGRPRVRPIDGLYLDGTIYVGGSPKTRWVREVGRTPHVSVHLDGTEDVVIVEGDAEVLTGIDEALAERSGRRVEREVPRVRDDGRLLPAQRRDRDPAAQGHRLDGHHPRPDPVPLRRPMIRGQ